MDLASYLVFRLAASSCGTKTGLLPSLYDPPVQCAPDATGTQTLVITSMHDVLAIGGNVVRILIAASGGLAIIVIVVAALYYVTSTGDPARIKRAKDILTYMALGLILIISSYAIVTYIAKGF